ncbi:hypothetical protein BHM03_00005939 [Ensete ventricosum]|nr:hypothetical protein BHM03_00005939 [Ensete ventricosum]
MSISSTSSSPTFVRYVVIQLSLSLFGRSPPDTCTEHFSLLFLNLRRAKDFAVCCLSQIQEKLCQRGAFSFRLRRTYFTGSNEENADINWDDLGFGLVPTDYMYVMRCSRDDNFSSGVLTRYGNIELSPSAGVLNYGQGLFEGLKAYRKQDGGGFLLFRPEENARRMQMGAERMCMPSLSVEQFIHAVKETVLANKRWVCT